MQMKSKTRNRRTARKACRSRKACRTCRMRKSHSRRHNYLRAGAPNPYTTDYPLIRAEELEAPNPYTTDYPLIRPEKPIPIRT